MSAGLLMTALSVASLNYAVTIHTSGTILCPRAPRFTIRGENGTYTGFENVPPYRKTSSSDAAALISTVFGWMDTGDSVEFLGDFVWAGEVTLSKSAYLNFTKANVTAAYSIILNIISPAVAIIEGGYWKGTVYNARIRFQSSTGYSIINNTDAVNFKLEFTEYCGPYMTVKNCYFHDSDNLSYCIASNNQGYNTFQNCKFYNTEPGVGGIFVDAKCGYCIFENCIFDSMGYHSLYLSSYSNENLESPGNHVIQNCTFQNSKNYNQAGIHLKTQKCKIYNNIFRNMSGNAVPISLYSDWTYSNANYNEIFNNTFENLQDAIRLGGHLADAPQYGNKIYNNTFKNVAAAIALNYASSEVTHPLVDTWIYYNRFIDCASVFPVYTAGSSQYVINTTIAYNLFSHVVPADEQNRLQSYVNTLIYENRLFNGTLAMEDYPVPLPPNLPIPPP
jgi:hypothetical protein